MPCLEVWPSPECGWNGECIEENGTSFCVCNDGASQSLEMNFLVEENELKFSICLFNGEIDTLYLIAVLVLVPVTFLSILNAKTRAELLEIRYWLAFAINGFIVCLYRVIDSEALLGVDIAFSSLVSLQYVLFFVFSFEKLLESFRYAEGRAALVGVNNLYFLNRQIGVIKRFHLFTSIVSSLLAQSFWVACLITPRTDALNLFKIFWGWLMLHFGSAGIFTFLLYNEIVNDMREVLRIRRIGSHGPNSEVDKQLDALIPVMRRLRDFLAFTDFVWVLVSALVFIDFWLLCWGYILPIIQIQATLFGFAYVVSKCIKRGGRKGLSQSSKTYSSTSMNTSAKVLSSETKFETSI